MYEQTAEQAETGVRVMPRTASPTVPKEWPARQPTAGDARGMRAEILKNAHENLALAHKHLVDGLEWLAVTDLGMSEDRRRKHTSLKKQIGDLVDGVEEMRQAYVHSPQM